MSSPLRGVNATADGTDGTGDATLDAMLDATLDPALDEGVLAGLRRCHGGGGGGGKTATGAAAGSSPSEANSAPMRRGMRGSNEEKGSKYSSARDATTAIERSY